MSGAPLAARVVEVIADLGEAAHPRYRHGSGCVVAGRTVLTAAHVVDGAVSVKVRDPDKVIHEATLDPGFVGEVNGPGPDLALVELTGPEIAMPAVGLAVVDRNSASADPVERCHAVGYPAFMERDAPGGGRVRETADAFGHVPVLSGLAGGLLSLQVSSAPRPLPSGGTALGASQWSGMSGGPVFAGGLLLGVVTEHAPREGDSAITATPLSALETDPAHPGWGPGVADPGAWWARLGCSGVNALRPLPAPQLRAEPPYWATVRDIHQRTGTLVGREDELAGIASFVAGAEGYRWLAGDAWAGKTSLLAEAVALTGDECDVVCYFLSRRKADADSSRFLAAVVPQLAYLLEEDPPVADSHQYRALWQRAVQRAEAEDRHLLLVVDGLDEDLRPPGLPSVAALLPLGAGGRAHVLVSSRPHLELRRDLPPRHALAQMEPVTIRRFEGGDELADLAFQEIDDLLSRDDDGLAADVLGLLTAAAGPLAVADLVAMSAVAPRSAALTRRIRRLIAAEAARSLQPIGLAKGDRYQFAHESLLEQAQDNEDLNDPDYLRRIHQWADSWRAAGWPPADGAGNGTPHYLLDTYPSTLTEDPQRLAALVSDAGWVDAAVQSVGVDRVLADLARAAAADPASVTVAAVLATVRGQAAALRSPGLMTSQLLRQLCLQATELDEKDLASDIRRRLGPYVGPVPQWSTRRPYRALIAEVNAQAGWVNAVALARDGRVVAGTDDGRVWIWDPSTPSAGTLTLGRHDGPVRALAVQIYGRVVSGGHDKRVLLWDPDRMDAGPVELGRHDGAVRAVAFLDPDHVVSGGDDWLVRIWAVQEFSHGSTVLGRHAGAVRGVAVGRGGQVVSGGDDGRVCLWDPEAPGTALAKTDPIGGRVMTVAVASDNSVIAAGTDRVLYRWHHEFSDTRVNPDLAVQSGGQLAELGSHHNVVRAASVVLGGAREGLVISGGDDGRLRLWQAHDRGVERTDLGRHDGPVRAVWAGDDRAVSGGRDQRVRVWDLGESNLAVPERSQVLAGRVFALSVCQDGHVVSGGADGRLWLWEPDRAADPIELGRHESPIMAASALPGSLVVSCAADGRLHVWNRAAPDELVCMPGSHEGAVLSCAGGSEVVSGGYDGRVLLWDVAGGGRPVLLGVHSGPVSAVTVLPDGRIATGGTAGDVMIWRARSPGGEDIELEPMGARLNALTALPGGLVGGGDDGCIWMWDLGLRAVESVAAHGSSWLTSLASLDDHLITAGTDGQMIAWKIGPGGLTPVSRVACTVSALASGRTSDGKNCLAVAHSDSGLSYWLFNAPA